MGAGFGGFCPSDSARGRFKEPARLGLLTVGVLVPFEGRAPGCANGFSEAGLEALVIFILGFEASLDSGFSRGTADGGGVGTGEDALASTFGVDGPASFSRRRLRI